MNTILDKEDYRISHKEINEKPENMRKINIVDLQGTAFFINKCRKTKNSEPTNNSLKQEVAAIKDAVKNQMEFEKTVLMAHRKISKTRNMFIILATVILILLICK